MGSGEKPPKTGAEGKGDKPPKKPKGEQKPSEPAKPPQEAPVTIPVLPAVSDSDSNQELINDICQSGNTTRGPPQSTSTHSPDRGDEWPMEDYGPYHGPGLEYRPVGYGYGMPGGMYTPYPPPPPPPEYFWPIEGAQHEGVGPDTCVPQESTPISRQATHQMSDDEEEGELTGLDHDDANLLAEYEARYSEDTGPPVDEAIAKVINAMWNKGRDTRVVKDLVQKYPRPENIKPQRVEINEEVIMGLPKFAKSRDFQLRAAQQSIARAVVPSVANVSTLMTSKPLDRQNLLNQSMDTLVILGHANAQLNQARRELLKASIQPRYQVLCKPRPEVDTSKFLFGDNLPDRIKNATQGGKISKRGGRGAYGNTVAGTRGRYQPYSAYGYSRGAYHAYNRGRARVAFLGKSNSTLASQNVYDYVWEKHETIVHETVCHDVLQQCAVSESPFVDCFRPEQRGGHQSQGLHASQQPEGQVNHEMDSHLEFGEVGEYQLPAIIERSKWPVFVGGRVSQCAVKWSQLTKDWAMLRQLRGLWLEFDQFPPQQTFIPRPLRFNDQETEFLRSEIASLLQKQVIIEVDHIEGEFISQVFLREKRTPGKYRMILNLKKLNLNMEKIHFKMDTLLSILALVEPGMKMLSVDFSDAYYSLAVAPHHRKYLRFEFEGKLYEFQVVPMGLTSAPRHFTKVLKIPLSHLREKGYTIAGYLDDQLILASNDQEAVEAGTYAAQLFEDLGFTINVEKSVTRPTCVIEHLGFIINSLDMTVTMTTDKVNKIMALIHDCLEQPKLTIRLVSKLLGKFNATRPANPWAGLYSKQLEIDKNLALAGNKYNFEAKMEISAKARADIHWWLEKLPSLSGPIRVPKPDLVIYTDASLEGWGGHNPQSGQSCGGRWDLDEQKHHINYLELKAVWLTLFSFCRNLTDWHIRVMSDNTTTVACINKQGSTQSFKCNSMARHIWDFAVDRNIWLSAAHCPGVLNTEADLASRVFKDETEWTLNQNDFLQICNWLGTPNIDLFASRLNCKVKPYCAWQPDPEAIFIDALMFDWTHYYFYAFPPFSVIHLVLQKIMQEETEGIVVVPWWSTKPWFTQFVNMICADPIVMHVTDQTLFLPFSLRTHPLSGKLRLIAATLSGNRSRPREYRERLSQLCSKGGENLHRNCINLTSNFGHSIVAGGVQIPLKQLSTRG